MPISQKGQNLISASNIGSAPLPLAFELLSDIHVSILYEDIHDFKNRQNRQNRQRLQKDSPGPEHVKNDLGNSKQINIDCLICLSCLYSASSSRRAFFATSTGFPFKTGTLGSSGSTASSSIGLSVLLPQNASSSASRSACFNPTRVCPNTQRSFHSCIHIRASSFLRGLSANLFCGCLPTRCHRCVRRVNRWMKILWQRARESLDEDPMATSA